MLMLFAHTRQTMVQGENDDGRSEERTVDADRYRNPWPSTGRGKVMLGYFAGLSILYYFLIPAIGSTPTRVLGFPVLYWLTVLIYVTYAGGIFVLVYRPEARDSVEVGV